MIKSNTTKINIIYFFKFFADALYTPFIILFLKSCSYEGFKLGILLGIIPFGAIIGNILLTFLKANFKTHKTSLSLMLFLYGCGLFLLIFAHDKFILSFLAVFLISLVNNPSFNLEEGLASIIVKNDNNNYSLTRIFGSIGYFICLLILFFVPNNVKYDYIFYISGIIFLALGFVWIFIPNYKLEGKEKVSYKEIFKNKQFLAYFFMYFLFFGAYSTCEYFISDYVKSYSFARNEYSLMYALNVLIEVIMIFIVGKFIKKEHYKIVLFVSLFLLLLRSSLLSFPFLNKYFVAFLSISRGFAWGLFLSVHVNILMTFLKDNQLSKGILILCVGQNFVSAILNILGGNLLEKIQYNQFYIIISLCMFISFVMYLVYNFLMNRGKRDEYKN